MAASPRLARLLVLVLPFLAAATAALPPPDNWLSFRLVPTGNVVIASSLRVRWTAVTGGPISASPTIAGSTLYIGNNRGILDAIDVRTGRFLWTHHLDNALMSAPLLYRGFVIVGEGDQISGGSAPNRGRPNIRAMRRHG